MVSKFVRSMFAAAMVVSPIVSTAAVARDDDRYRDERVYRGEDHRYRQDCSRSSGTTGTIAGGVGGALVGNALGGGTLGTLAGAGGGGLLGRDLDKKHDPAQKRRNGC